jgi:hypothetical protein
MYTVTTNADWQLASANSTVAFQVTGAGAVEIALGHTAPVQGFIYESHQGDRGDVTTLFPTSSSSNVWVRSSFPSEVTIG